MFFGLPNRMANLTGMRPNDEFYLMATLREIAALRLYERGRLFISTDIGYGLVHSMDMEVAARAVEQGPRQPQEMPFAQMPRRFGYLLMPQV